MQPFGHARTDHGASVCGAVITQSRTIPTLRAGIKKAPDKMSGALFVQKELCCPIDHGELKIRLMVN